MRAMEKKRKTALARARAGTPLTQPEAAEKMGMSLGSYQKKEYGTRRLSIKNIRKAAEVFGKPASFFVEDAEPLSPRVWEAIKALNGPLKGWEEDAVLSLLHSFQQSRSRDNDDNPGTAEPQKD